MWLKVKQKKKKKKTENLEFFEAVQGVRMSAVPGSSKDCESTNTSIVPQVQTITTQNSSRSPQPGTSNHFSNSGYGVQIKDYQKKFYSFAKMKERA